MTNIIVEGAIVRRRKAPAAVQGGIVFVIAVACGATII